MSALHWFQVSGAARGMPRRERTHRKPWPTLGLLACLALIQSGCQSGPFSNCGSGCGGCGSGMFGPTGFFSRVQNRVFSRSNSACCPSGVVTEGPVEYATPAAVVSPGTTVPSYQSGAGTVTSPSVVPPLPSEPAGELNPVEPLPKVKSLGPPSGSNSSGSLPGNKTSYQTRRQDPSTRIARRPVTLPRTTVSTSEPTPRSAQAQTRRAPDNATAADDQDPLDHLPPLDLPGEVTKSAASPPVPPAANRSDQPTSDAKKAPAGKGEPPAPAADELDLTSGPGPQGPVGPSVSAETGIKRFVSVDLKLAGGSAPSSEGLKWLADKGYRTVLDLRESREVPANFIAEVTGLGLRYVALPTNLEKINRNHIERFNFEVNIGEARPLFFFDSDGTRAGALWYIRRVTNDRMDHQIARREAESLGLTDQSAWTVATSYVDGKNASRASASPPTPAQNEPKTNPSVSMGELQNEKETAAPRDVASASPAAAQPEANNPIVQSTPPSTPVRSDAKADPSTPAPVDLTASNGPPISVAWRPFAAMVISGLAVPLAYLSRTATPALVSKALACLPGMERQPKSLPTKSDV